MPLPPPDCSRKPLHNRIIHAHSFEREDGLWDIEAELIDSKSYDYTKRSGAVQQAGQPFHHMHLRITIDSDLVIQKAEAAYDAAPYGENCTCIAPDYGDMVGMSLLKSFRNQVRERFGRTAGCTHLNELAGLLPTVAMQTMAAKRRKAQEAVTGTPKKPFQLEGCHALRLDGPVALEFYPQWYQGEGTDTKGTGSTGTDNEAIDREAIDGKVTDSNATDGKANATSAAQK